MGLLDRFFSGSKKTQPEPKANDYLEKRDLVYKITGLVEKIRRLNPFDSVIRDFSRDADLSLKLKSVEELKAIKPKLENRLMELEERSQMVDPSMEKLEAAKWTGERLPGMSAKDLDRWQKSDDGR